MTEQPIRLTRASYKVLRTLCEAPVNAFSGTEIAKVTGLGSELHPVRLTPA